MSSAMLLGSILILTATSVGLTFRAPLASAIESRLILHLGLATGNALAAATFGGGIVSILKPWACPVEIKVDRVYGYSISWQHRMAKQKGERRPGRFTKGYCPYGTTEEHGDPDTWRAAFAEAMTDDRAEELLGKDTPWSVLGIANGATGDQIKKAYRKLAKKWHPDRNPGNEDAAGAMFKKVQAAYWKLTGKN